MAVPESYTDETLGQFMLGRLGDVADALGWTDATSLAEAVNDTLIAYGVTDVADVTDLAKVRALATYYAWRSAVASLVARYDFSRPEGSYSRSQMIAAAERALSRAEAEAGPFLPPGSGGVVYVKRLLHDEDPYRLNAQLGEW